MKYYKDENNNVYAYKKDGSQDAYIKPNLVLITQKEMKILTTRVPEFDPEFNRFIIGEKKRVATEQIAILNDAIELGLDKDGDKEKVLKLRQYRIKLNQLDPNDESMTIPDYPF